MIFAAVRVAHPGISSSCGFCSATRVFNSASNSLIRRENAVMSRIRSRQIRTCVVCGCRAILRASDVRTRVASRPRGRIPDSRSGSRSCRCQRSREMRRVRSPTRSSRWSTSNLTSVERWAGSTAGRFGSRNAARAIAKASIGSDLPGVRTEARVLAISFEGTRTHGWPAASNARSNRPET